jgi:calcium-binding protein CML
MQEELKEMVENVDTDGSGSIEFLEFLLLMGKILNDSPNQEDLRNIFTGQVFLPPPPPPL